MSQINGALELGIEARDTEVLEHKSVPAQHSGQRSLPVSRGIRKGHHSDHVSHHPSPRLIGATDSHIHPISVVGVQSNRA